MSSETLRRALQERPITREVVREVKSIGQIAKASTAVVIRQMNEAARRSSADGMIVGGK